MCFKETDIWLPKKAKDPNFMKKWAVIACDQYTSDVSYWEKTKEFVGGAMSALNLVFPEIYLETESQGEQKNRIDGIAEYMGQYENGLERHRDSMLYIERTLKNGAVRQGLVGALDLEEYDYSDASKAKIRPTEKTVPERLPPRVKIREKALFELPHAMVLFADEKNILMAEIQKSAANMKKLYDFELMRNSGAIECRSLDAENIAFAKRRLKSLENNGMLFAVGDGNHSLAAAKKLWENLKKTLPPGERETHPARYALAEIVNIYDESLEFEPIYRIMFEVEPDELIDGMKKFYGMDEKAAPNSHGFEIYHGEHFQKLHIPNPKFPLPVESLQAFLDEYQKKRGGKIDYVHGKAETLSFAKKEGSVGFVFETMKKSELFAAVEKKGVLPRKAFSMGEADDKRFYIECRRIK